MFISSFITSKITSGSKLSLDFNQHMPTRTQLIRTPSKNGKAPAPPTCEAHNTAFKFCFTLL